MFSVGERRGEREKESTARSSAFAVRGRTYLKTANKIDGVLPSEVGVFARRLNVAPPARVANEVNHRCPVRRVRVAGVHEGPSLDPDLLASRLPQRAIEGPGRRDGERKVRLCRSRRRRAVTHVGYAMRRLAPPVVRIQPERRERISVRPQRVDLLCEA